MTDALLARQFAQRLMAARAELAMVDAEMTLLEARRTALQQYIEVSNRLGNELAGHRHSVITAAREIETSLSDEAETPELAAQVDHRALAASPPASAEGILERSMTDGPSVAAAVAPTEEQAAPASEAAVKRRPGRPKGSKSLKLGDTVVDGPAGTNPARRRGEGRGRTRKAAGNPASDARPDAVVPPETTDASASAAPLSDQAPPSPARRKPGRKARSRAEAVAPGSAVASLRDAPASIGDVPARKVRSQGRPSRSHEPLDEAPGGATPADAGKAPADIVAQPKSNAPEPSLANTILDVLRDRPGLTPIGEIAERVRKRLGVQRFETTPGQALAELRKDGLVQRVGHKWRISTNADELQALFNH